MTELLDSYSKLPLPSTPRVLFMGTPEFAVPTLRRLASCTRVVAVVSQPDRPKGRGKRLQRTPVAQCADELDLPVFQWPKLNQESYDALSALNFDLAVVIAYGKILPKRYLCLPQWGCVNLHASVLPKLRGAAPIQWALIKGMSETGVSVMRLDEGMDTGPVALIKKLNIDQEETAQSLTTRLANLSADALEEALSLWKKGELNFEPQVEHEVSHARMLTKGDGIVDFNSSATKIKWKNQGLSLWPGSYIPLDHGSLKLLKLSVLDQNIELKARQSFTETLQRSPQPGELLTYSEEGPVICCKEGAVTIHQIQIPNRKPMSGSQYLQSRQIKLGETLI